MCRNDFESILRENSGPKLVTQSILAPWDWFPSFVAPIVNFQAEGQRLGGGGCIITQLVCFAHILVAFVRILQSKTSLGLDAAAD
jgi:hypothetical protein